MERIQMSNWNVGKWLRSHDPWTRASYFGSPDDPDPASSRLNLILILILNLITKQFHIPFLQQEPEKDHHDPSHSNNQRPTNGLLNHILLRLPPPAIILHPAHVSPRKIDLKFQAHDHKIHPGLSFHRPVLRAARSGLKIGAPQRAPIQYSNRTAIYHACATQHAHFHAFPASTSDSTSQSDRWRKKEFQGVLH